MEDALHRRVDAAVSDKETGLGMGEDILLGHRLGNQHICGNWIGLGSSTHLGVFHNFVRKEFHKLIS